MGDSDDRELALLRVRAYGPDADIHTDPRALARLRELERAPQAAVSGNGAAPPAPLASPIPPLPPAAPRVPAASSPPAVPQPPIPSTPASVAAAGSIAGAARFSPRTRLFAACAATAVAATAIAVPMTLWASADRPYAVLHATDEPPSEMFSPGPESPAQRYEDFFGLEVTVGVLDYMDGRCILIQPTISEYTYFTPAACSPPGFEPVVDVSTLQMRLSDDAPAVLGDVSGLRFAVAGDEVHVFVATVPDEDDAREDAARD